MMAGYLVSTARLPSAILELLKEGPRTTDELCGHFGYSASATRYRLHGLEDLGAIHHQKHVYSNGGGSYYTWHHGKRTSTTTTRLEPLACKPKMPPAVICRDPLVAALFGAPAHTSMVSA